uniref:Putative conserved secreted protein n=1 Tax=Rhipicephalus microplus TaxID=6941 RepID=A0A6G5A4S3_RHIMP
MKTTLVILLLALSASGYAATIPADATTNQAALNAFKRSYEVIEKIIADKQEAAEQEESVAETLKALANLQTNVDPESEEYFLAQLFQKAVAWLVQKGVSKGVEYGVGKAIKG